MPGQGSGKKKKKKTHENIRGKPPRVDHEIEHMRVGTKYENFAIPYSYLNKYSPLGCLGESFS